MTTIGKKLPEKVDIIKVGHLSIPNAGIYGGLGLSTCTSGFSVSYADGTKGITTAAHCNDSQSFNGTDLPHEGSAEGASADVQWHTAPGFTAENRIKIGSSTRSITGTVNRNNQPIAAYVCKYGKTTGYACGQIVDKNYRRGSLCSDGRACYWSATWMKVGRDSGSFPTAGGDSGGPWFSGNQAWGIHAASQAVNGKVYAIYMAINYLSHIGTTVLTN